MLFLWRNFWGPDDDLAIAKSFGNDLVTLKTQKFFHLVLQSDCLPRHNSSWREEQGDTAIMTLTIIKINVHPIMCIS